MIPLAEKYRASCFADIKGQEMAVEKVRSFFKNFPFKKAIILYGNAGTGKTSLAHSLAKEMSLEIFELNASDLRNRKKLEEVMKPATQQKTLFAKQGKVILVDEVDGVTATDYGGLTELIALIEKSSFPIIITANNIWQQKFNLLRRKCDMVKMKDLSYLIILNIIREITQKEGKAIQEDLLKTIAAKSRGDVRAALNDLQTVLETNILPKHIEEREKEEDIFQIMKRVFKNKSDPDLIRAYDSTDMSIDEIFLWIEENIPYEFKGEELYTAYEALSKADVFRGRIYRQQHWRFMVYEYFLLSAGIAFSSKKQKDPNEFTSYQRPKRILQIWLQKQKNAKKTSISAKYAKYVHVSKKRALKEFYFLPYIIDEHTAEKMDLSPEEIKYLKEFKVKK